MGQNLSDYLTGDERRQMDALLQKAEARMKEKGADGCRGQFLLMTCQCECEPINQKEQEGDNLPNDFENLLGQICDFCKKHSMCPEYCAEELPFS